MAALFAGFALCLQVLAGPPPAAAKTEPPAPWQVEGLRAALADPNLEVQRLALAKAAALGVPALMPLLTDLMNSDDRRLALSAVEALAAAGAEAELLAERVVALMGEAPLAESPEMRWLGGWKLDPERQAPSVQALLRNEDPGARLFAFRAFAQMDREPVTIGAFFADFQDSRRTIGAYNALAAMGERTSAFSGRVKELLEDGSLSTQIAAIRILIAQGAPVSDYGETLLKLLDEYEQRHAALDILMELGPEASELAPLVADQIGTIRPDFRVHLIALLGRVGGAAYAQTAVELLKRDDNRFRSGAIAFFEIVGAEAEAYATEIAPLLSADEDAAKLSAIEALIAIRADPALYAGAVHDLMKNADTYTDPVLFSLLRALATMEPAAARQHLAVIFDRLQNIGRSEPPFERAVGKFFGLFSEDPTVARQAADLLEHPYDTTKMLGLIALGTMGPGAKAEVGEVQPFVSHGGSKIRRIAQSAFVAIQGDTPGTAAIVAEHLRDFGSDPLVDRLGPLRDLKEVLALLEPGYDQDPPDPRYRFLAHYLGGGGERVAWLLRWIGGPESPEPVADAAQENAGILEALAAAREASAPDTRVREALTEQMARVITTTTWEEDQVALLESVAGQFRDDLEAGGDDRLRTYLDSLDRKLEAARPKPGEIWTRAGLSAVGAHLLFWILLIVAYPRSVWVQTWFFWNPWMRRIAGLGYVNLLLTSVPFLRRLLFTPFRTALVADASLEELERQSYFAGISVLDEDSGQSRQIDAAIPEIRGQIYLEGESGLGKSMFLRRLAANSPRTLAFLPATQCAEGVLEAVRNRLPGLADDKRFLESLIYAGAFDIAIDGLNEVSAEIRAGILQFLRRFTRGNVLLASQPIAWSAPETLRRYTVEPLADDLIEAFLISRSEALPESAPITGDDYRGRCQTFLTRALPAEGGAESEAVRRVLSNPMDLTMVAQMLAFDKEPNLFNLQAQHYELMAQDFTKTQAGSPFPFEGVCEMAYEMRLRGAFSLPSGEFEDAVECMERHRMVVARRAGGDDGGARTTRYFRHDKIMEFFIAHTLLGNPARQSEHLGDARFQGVYFLLATSMPLDEAEALRETLIDYAADTKDHSVSDTFVQLLRERKSAAA